MSVEHAGKLQGQVAIQAPMSVEQAGRLQGRVAVVTGAASGIGAAVVRRFCAEGARVYAAGLQIESLEALATEVGAQAVACDVTQDEQVRRLIDLAAAQGAAIDVVVNAAGIMHEDDAADIEDSAWQRVLDVNLSGAMRVCRAAIPRLQAARGGAIVNIASVAAFNASVGMASYSASKAGLIALTRAIANRYGVDGIRANCVCPGWVRTPMSEVEMAAVVAKRGGSVDEAFAALGQRIALGRVAMPDELASCVLFLASAEASFVTGAALVADGGAKVPAAARAV